MLALRRRRMAASPAILRGGFRPFFFGGACWAVIALTLWLLSLSGMLTLPTAFDPLAWHRHEMLFGFVGAIMSGFLLTAIPNWTGGLPIAGWPLLSLFGLWFAARIAVLCSALIGRVPAAVVDVGFFLVLAVLGAREVVAAKNRNVPIVGMILLFGFADALDHAALGGLIGAADIGWRTGIAIVVVLISLIGGRVTPSFTRNWVAKQGMTQGLPTQPGRLDLLVRRFCGARGSEGLDRIRLQFDSAAIRCCRERTRSDWPRLPTSGDQCARVRAPWLRHLVRGA